MGRQEWLDKISLQTAVETAANDETRQGPSGADFNSLEEAYTSFFGRRYEKHSEILPVEPRIDVLVFPPGHSRRDFYTIVTYGMSSSTVAGADRRTELLFYCESPEEQYIATLRGLAHFAHDHSSPFTDGSVLPNGAPPSKVFTRGPFDTYLFIASPIRPEGLEKSTVRTGGQQVELLLVVPITSSECDLKVDRGLDGLFDLFARESHPYVFVPERDSYI